MKVKCKVVQTYDRGALTRAECLRCDHATESFGHGESSVRRCLALLRDECPNNEENFYVNEDDE
jgi:hypothetical protein